MTIKFYVAEGEHQCPEEDADFVRYEDYERLRVAAQKGLAILKMYEGIFSNSFHKGAIQALEVELNK